MSCGNLAGWKTEAQSVKRSTQKKKEPKNENKNHYDYEQEAG